MRGKQAKKRKLTVDPKFGSKEIARLINYVMQDGKKSVARKVVYDALDEMSTTLKGDPVELFQKALANVKPSVEIRPRRVGGANYQVPIQVPETRQEALAMRWILEGVKAGRGGKSIATVLANELINATKKEGSAYKKKEDTIKMAEANKAFAHFGA
jgi:small subunit ribosomal protein S7